MEKVGHLLGGITQKDAFLGEAGFVFVQEEHVAFRGGKDEQHPIGSRIDFGFGDGS